MGRVYEVSHINVGNASVLKKLYQKLNDTPNRIKEA